MKTRTGFVSNSSSSSFVAAIDGGLDEVVFELKVKVSDLGIVCTTIDELNVAFLDHYGWRQKTVEELFADEGKWLRDRYQRCVDAINAGKKIVIGTVSNDDYDNTLSMMFYNHGALPAKGMEELTGEY